VECVKIPRPKTKALETIKKKKKKRRHEGFMIHLGSVEYISGFEEDLEK
jgi:hypothetical protein